MALPNTEEDLVPLHKEILTFLSTRTIESEIVQKRQLVASKRLSVSLDKGELQIQYLKAVLCIRIRMDPKLFSS
jgi:hypothetical protein